MKKRIVMAVAAVILLAGVGIAAKAHAYSCTTTCNTIGGFQTCNTSCY